MNSIVDNDYKKMALDILEKDRADRANKAASATNDPPFLNVIKTIDDTVYVEAEKAGQISPKEAEKRVRELYAKAVDEGQFKGADEEQIQEFLDESIESIYEGSVSDFLKDEN